MDPLTSPLQAVVGEVEGHVAEAGWDQPPQLFALVSTEQLLRAEPQLAQTMGLIAGDPSSLTPIAQEPLGEGPLDEQLASLVFSEEVLGVVLAHEVLVLPPSAETALQDVEDLPTPRSRSTQAVAPPRTTATTMRTSRRSGCSAATVGRSSTSCSAVSADGGRTRTS